MLPTVYDETQPADNPSTLHLSRKRELYDEAWPFEDYTMKYAMLTKPAILENFAKNGPANIINSGGCPTHKRVTVIAHADLKATFPGVESYLPPCTSGPAYPDDFKWAVWMQAPVSSTYRDGHYGAFLVVAKALPLWQAAVEQHAGRTDPNSPPTPMWTPITLMRAVER